MSLPVSEKDNRIQEVLDLCLSSESPQVQRKVYEIIHRSGLEPSDPLFLILALTGQMRVFLESAPAELNQLLAEWKDENAASLAAISEAVAGVKDSQKVQAEVFRSSLDDASRDCLTSFKATAMATVGAIADANGETLEQVQKTKQQNEDLLAEIKGIQAEVRRDREQTLEGKRAFAGFVGKTTKDLSLAHEQISLSHAEIREINNKTLWLKWADWFAPLSALALVGGAGLLIGGGLVFQWFNHPTARLGRDIGRWNLKRIVSCHETNSSQCSLWIVPPDSSQRSK